MDSKDLVAIFDYLEREKGIKREIVAQAIEEALLIAARKSVSDAGANISVTINPKNGDIEVLSEKEVVAGEAENADAEISLADAKELNPGVEVGQVLQIVVTPSDFGRVAAQVARQVITQRLRSAERDVIYEEYRHRVGDIVSGGIKRIGKGATLVIDLGKVEAILPGRFYPKTEKHHVGERVTALMLEVRDTDIGGAEVVLTRSHPEFVKELFIQEVPELGDGTIEVNKIVREAGYRTKMAVSSNSPKVDPVGSCVGVRGTRVKNIIRELGNEKIDIIPYTEDPVELLQRAIDPVEIKKIHVDEEEGVISIVVSDEDYPTVLGKKGMNTRLIGNLLEKELEVQKMSEYQKASRIERQQLALSENPKLDEPLVASGNLSNLAIDSLIAAEFDTPRKLLKADPQTIAEKAEIPLELVESIIEEVEKR
ncbi:MAG: transcription termination/antitermination protein NusA [Chlamydiia bacterium]|nr:transcription termination/antitermination protein NusA [Chlamydiia bacterium]